MRTSESKSDELLEAKEHIQSLKTELSDLRLIWSKKPGLEMIDRLRSKIVQLEEKENLKGKQLDEYVNVILIYEICIQLSFYMVGTFHVNPN